MESEDSLGSKAGEQPSTSLPARAGEGSSPARARRDVWRLLRSRTARQAGGFAGSGLVVNALALVSTAILTRNLRTTEFGSYAFANSLLGLVALFFEFGLFAPAARLAAVTNRRHKGEIVGAALVLYLPVGAAFAATVFALSFWTDDWFNVDAGHALRIAAPIAIAFPFVYALQQLAQGVDQLHVASLTSVLAQLLFVALLALVLVSSGDLSTSSALVVRSLAFLIAIVCGALWLRPAFGAVRRWGREILRQAREWGFHQTLGRLFSIGTYNMDVLMLGVWATPRWVGLYVLAGSVASASGLPVLGLSAALYPRMARVRAIAREWVVAAIAVGTATSLAAWLLAEPLIRVFFSDRYVAAASLVLPLVLAQLVRGVTTIFNTFLGAQGRGVELRNAGIVLTVSNVAFNFALIPAYGAHGAAWASLLALLANLIAHVFFYLRLYDF
jgi:O-antigen/teichoic acid export membrane protein